MTADERETDMLATAQATLTTEQIEFYQNHGYLRIPGVFSEPEADELAAELDLLMDEWAIRDQGWTGPWRRELMTADVERKSQLVAMHDLHYYSAAWTRAVTNARMVAVMVALLGPDVELHHSTMHIKPPETGHPFPMHQDDPFYPHADGRYVDVLVHLDDTAHENGEIRFLDGSHKGGRLAHVDQADGNPCTPHLPVERYRLEDTVPVPARRGDLVVFSIHTVHGSYINTTDRNRRLVRVGYRHPGNRQEGGQAAGRPGWMVAGHRNRHKGDELFPMSA